ncbi:MAG: Stp1/IreP family PP2C-type Ser/Thr phosphatase [Anaerolineae bacterium]|nr:Stp1/IreP family PP2C-type Ser/Thr phosphatase [Anaerolineae bacterium]MDW8172613.1 Stp1/IreP family PP2C-type Ser/Thr phosphatase [Anaerolineae bacterium]
MSQAERAIRLSASGLSDRGRSRQNNEDRVLVWQREALVLAIVADGMGGAMAGEEASRLAVEGVAQSLNAASSAQAYAAMSEEELMDRLMDGVRRANSDILRYARLHPELKGMGTTITLAFANGHHVCLAHVGDSRAYLVDGHDGSIIQLTQDHSFVHALMLAGHITLEEAEQHPMKHVLYRALGQSEDVDVDLLSGIYLNVGDRLVLCSDGLTLHVSPDEILEHALAHNEPETITRGLVNLANARGGKDNISVVVVVAESATPLPRMGEDYAADFSHEGDDPTSPLRS